MEEFRLILLTVLTSCCFKVTHTVPQANVSLLGGQVAIKGSTVQLVCSITDYSLVNLAAWTKSSSVSGNTDLNVVRCGVTCLIGTAWDSRYTISRDISGMYLNISNLNRTDDQKLWKCVLQNIDPAVTAQLNLIVYTSPVGVIYNNPLVTNQDLTVDTVTLTCETTKCASPVPAFTWYYMDGSTRVRYTDDQAQESSQSQSCVTSESEFRYSSTLTLPRYTAFTGNINKKAQFVCGATHPALSDGVYTVSSVQVTFAVHVEGVTLKDGSNTPGTGTNIQVEENTENTLTVEFSPVNSRPGPTITCYVGNTSYTVSATNLQFTFTPRNGDHGQSVYCEAYNRGEDTFKVTSNKPKLYVKVYVTSVVIKDGSSILQTGEVLTVEENTLKSLTFEYQPSVSRPAPTVTCYLGTSTTSMSGSTFTFTPNNSNHGYKVYCQAANRDDPSVKVTSGRPQLYIKVGVSSVTLNNATSDGSDLVMMDGRQETLVCVTSRTRPAAEVVWYFDNTQHFTVQNVINSVSTDMFTVTSTLTVTSSRSYKGQQVTCRAWVQPQHFVSSVEQRINVWYAPSQPSVSISPQFPWLEGRSSSLSCVTSDPGNPVSMVTWEHSTNSAVSDSKLVFLYISAEDDGKNISCQLTNGFTGGTWITSQSVTLNIEYKPIVTITVDGYSTPVVLNEGSRLSAMCQVSGNPVPVGQWKGYPSGEQLTIDDIDRSQTGTFQCVATATSTTHVELKTTSTFSATVQYAPDVNITVTPTSVVENNGVSLNCDPHGLPEGYTYHRFVHSWYNTELEIRNNTRNFRIPTAGLEHSGRYTCYVDNGIPSRNQELIQSGSVEIKVQVTPYVHLPNDGKFVGQPGSKIKVEVPFYSHPPISSMMIFKDNQTISNSSGYTVYHTVGIVPVTVRGKQQLEINGSKAVLEIENVLQSDLGDYTLQLTNGINKAIFMFKVIASRKPFDPAIVVAGAPYGAVISLVWSNGFNGGHDQTFVIEYRLSGADAWTEYERVEENDITYILPNGSYYTNITGLSAGEYSIRLHATNEKGQSGFVNMTNIIIEEDEVSTTQPLPVAAIAGGAAAGIVVILVVAVVIFLVRRYSSKDDRLTKQMEMERRSSDIEVINVNDQYVSAGTVNVHQNQGLASSNDEYATVNKPKKQQPPASETYAVVDKTRFKKKGGKKESSDTQQQAENIYENPGGSVPSQSASPKPRKNQDGLIYIEVDFSKDKKKGDKKPVIIHGLDDQTTYAEVAIGKRGTPLPESDEEDHASSSK